MDCVLLARQLPGRREAIWLLVLTWGWKRASALQGSLLRQCQAVSAMCTVPCQTEEQMVDKVPLAQCIKK